MKNAVQLKKKFDTKDYQPGASVFKQLLWYFTSCLFFRSGLIPFSSVLAFILRLFGARIGQDVRIKPYVHIKYPWKFTMGDHSWIAECFIENLDDVIIGRNVCVSQKAVLMTGNHNYKTEGFDLMTGKIFLEDGVWIGAGAMVCPGVHCYSHAVLAAGAIATKDLEAYSIYQGNPAVKVRDRVID
ncbi:colanic acid biosynthesis acetyltransferase WcaF (plasmid) [Pedobacter sp. BS3]|uniref:WcaF family extracellular polysaccharide biosynthesis acetyltransferase n=1 Tax=Pedobacter sp. BS3 TaxID=2567937 RepID=UPI0011EC998D|nr:WcaF family extracellular polysaccharide biosynthesis acetyltransferase [Pedobacter sp. BS3]TZF86221.1 colanic acid biosynthesis acetyltransferase WcaF [Pedobacter sp. BS3]